MLRRRSSESAIPSGMITSQPKMKTRRTESLILLHFFFDSKRSKGADGEVLDSEVILPIVGKTFLVE